MLTFFTIGLATNESASIASSNLSAFEFGGNTADVYIVSWVKSLSTVTSKLDKAPSLSEITFLASPIGFPSLNHLTTYSWLLCKPWDLFNTTSPGFPKFSLVSLFMMLCWALLARRANWIPLIFVPAFICPPIEYDDWNILSSYIFIHTFLFSGTNG